MSPGSEPQQGPQTEKPPAEQIASDSTVILDIPVLKTTNTSSSRLWKHLTADVRPSCLAEVELLLLTFCTGLQGEQSQINRFCPITYN